jgi:hypothetical protein
LGAQRGCAGTRLTGVRCDQRDDRIAVQFGGNHRKRRSEPEVRDEADLVRRLSGELAEEAEDIRSHAHRPRQHAGQHLGPERVKSELERGDDPEVAAAAAQAPEQVRVLVLAGGDQIAVGGHDVAGQQVVDG